MALRTGRDDRDRQVEHHLLRLHLRRDRRQQGLDLRGDVGPREEVREVGEFAGAVEMHQFDARHRHARFAHHPGLYGCVGYMLLLDGSGGLHLDQNPAAVFLHEDIDRSEQPLVFEGRFVENRLTTLERCCRIRDCALLLTAIKGHPVAAGDMATGFVPHAVPAREDGTLQRRRLEFRRLRVMAPPPQVFVALQPVGEATLRECGGARHPVPYQKSAVSKRTEEETGRMAARVAPRGVACTPARRR